MPCKDCIKYLPLNSHQGLCLLKMRVVDAVDTCEYFKVDEYREHRRKVFEQWVKELGL